ncbi:hypothetical protein Ddc_17904 [Ditylenchus destructor]|nr:hypothetical protein Ddc_17904 [Ditylenchus destructor]
MSCSKPVPKPKSVPPYILFDSLYYLNRDQLERFSIVCRSLKNFIDRYFQSTAIRVFDQLDICGGTYALIHNGVKWNPNHNSNHNSIQQFLAGERLNAKDTCGDSVYYSFAEMRPYLGPTVRIKSISYTYGGSFYNPEHVAEMESIAYLWRDGTICILPKTYTCAKDFGSQIVAEDFQPILSSPTILQCRNLQMYNAHFSFKDYKVLYTVKVFEMLYYPYDDHEYDDALDSNCWPEFLDRPGVKPVVVLHSFPYRNVVTVLNRLTKAFSSAVSPNAFKVVFEYECDDQITEFRTTNMTSGEKLELKTEIPLECHAVDFDNDYYCTIERSSI